LKNFIDIPSLVQKEFPRDELFDAEVKECREEHEHVEKLELRYLNSYILESLAICQQYLCLRGLNMSKHTVIAHRLSSLDKAIKISFL